MSIAHAENAAELFKLPFEELSEVFFSGVLLSKLPEGVASDLVTVQIGLADLYFPQAIADAVGNPEVDVHSQSSVERDVANAFSVLFGNPFADDAALAQTREPQTLGAFFGSRIENALRFLRDGDSCDLVPAIESFERESLDTLEVPVFKVKLLRSKFLAAFKVNLVAFVRLQDRAYEKLMAGTDVSVPVVTIEKQLGFLRDHFDARSKVTGETQFSFSLKQVNFRRVVMHFEGLGGQGVMPSPLSGDAGVKAVLPFLLAVQGEIDLDQVKIASSIHEIDDIDIQFSVRRPAVRNVFGANYCALPSETRARMSGVAIGAYEKVVRDLQGNLCFVGRPTLERDFASFAAWTIKQVVYCLEEPTYLKEPALAWLRAHKADGYQRMEDDFFLPFLYERLRAQFGDLVSKKPERFGGNVDILFGEIPIELKVRKGHRDALVETVVDEKYKPTGQAATYAALTRLGCVMVLDIPTSSPTVTNLSSCIRVVTRHLPEAEHPTSIPVFIFQCDTPRPSDAK